MRADLVERAPGGPFARYSACHRSAAPAILFNG